MQVKAVKQRFLFKVLMPKAEQRTYCHNTVTYIRLLCENTKIEPSEVTTYHFNSSATGSPKLPPQQH